MPFYRYPGRGRLFTGDHRGRMFPPSGPPSGLEIAISALTRRIPAPVRVVLLAGFWGITTASLLAPETWWEEGEGPGFERLLVSLVIWAIILLCAAPWRRWGTKIYRSLQKREEREEDA